MPTEPRYQHDCSSGCTFLGQYGAADLYFCTQGGNLPTVIARYSSTGADYVSGMALMQSPDLIEARTRAMARGLLSNRIVVPNVPAPVLGRVKGFLLRAHRHFSNSIW